MGWIVRPMYRPLDDQLFDAPPVRRTRDLTDRTTASDPLLDAPGWPQAVLRDAAFARLAALQPVPDDTPVPPVPAPLRLRAQVVPVGPVPPTEPIDLRALRGGGQTLVAPEPVDLVLPDPEPIDDDWFAEDTVDLPPARELAPELPPIRPPWWALAMPLAGAVVGCGMALATLVFVLSM